MDIGETGVYLIALLFIGIVLLPVVLTLATVNIAMEHKRLQQQQKRLAAGISFGWVATCLSISFGVLGAVLFMLIYTEPAEGYLQAAGALVVTLILLGVFNRKYFTYMEALSSERRKSTYWLIYGSLPAAMLVIWVAIPIYLY